MRAGFLARKLSTSYESSEYSARVFYAPCRRRFRVVCCQCVPLVGVSRRKCGKSVWAAWGTKNQKCSLILTVKSVLKKRKFYFVYFLLKNFQQRNFNRHCGKLNGRLRQVWTVFAYFVYLIYFFFLSRSFLVVEPGKYPSVCSKSSKLARKVYWKLACWKLG